MPGDDRSASRAQPVGAWTVLPGATSSSMRGAQRQGDGAPIRNAHKLWELRERAMRSRHCNGRAGPCADEKIPDQFSAAARAMPAVRVDFGAGRYGHGWAPDELSFTAGACRSFALRRITTRWALCEPAFNHRGLQHKGLRLGLRRHPAFADLGTEREHRNLADAARRGRAVPKISTVASGAPSASNSRGSVGLTMIPASSRSSRSVSACHHSPWSMNPLGRASGPWRGGKLGRSYGAQSNAAVPTTLIRNRTTA